MRTCILAFALVSLACSAQAQTKNAQRGQADAGAGVAAKWCGECHVTGQGAGGSDMAPPFADIARTRSDDYIRGFLANPHGRRNMPPIMLDPKEVENVVAYLRSMRKPAKKPAPPGTSPSTTR